MVKALTAISCVDIFLLTWKLHGQLNFIWKLQLTQSERESLKELQVIEYINTTIPVFSTRQIRTEFVNRYSKKGLKPGILRDMYRFLTKYNSTAESTEQAAV